MALEFSPEQLDAIRTTGANLLVSAAAGAGKTAVLVARVLHLLDSPHQDFDLQNLLVVTFTRAAAREMKDRIGEAFRRKLEENPADAFYQRQLALLERAPISTLDAFCQALVRENFHILGINPGFTVLDADEADLLWMETIESVFENHYADDGVRGTEFRRLVDAYGGRREDQNLIAEVLRVASFLRTTADPEGWKRRAIEALAEFEESSGRAVSLPSTRWGQIFRESMVERLCQVEDRLRLAEQRLRSHVPDDPSLFNFLAALLGAAQDSRARLLQGPIDAWTQPLEEPSAARIPSAPRDLSDPEKAARLQIKEALIDPAREDLKSLVAYEGRYTAAQWVSGVQASLPLVQRLFLLTEEALDAFAKEKQKLSAVDFGDLERSALRALQEDSAHPTRPSAVARRYRDQFEHVLVDEFQDINELQSTFLALVSRQDDPAGRPPNLFAVGDVKQSIYGFRLADPEIFVAAYQSYQPLAARPGPDVPGDFRIDLPRNYRSRLPILQSVNAVFQRLMGTDLGGIPYDNAARLVCGRVAVPAPPGLSPDRCPDRVPTELLLVDAKAAVRSSPGEDAENRGRGNADAPAEGHDSRASLQESTEDDSFAVPGAAECEARVLAERLWHLVGREPDGSDAGLWIHAHHPEFPEKGPLDRPVRWSDIVILLRAITGRADQFCTVLRRCGIPLVAPPSSGLLDTLEARDLLSVLQVLDNPCQDIPLVAHLRSPFCGFNDNSLARIRLFTPEGDFFAALKAYSREGDEANLRDVCAAVIERLTRWRALAAQSPLAELLDRVLEETAYCTYLRWFPDGSRRQANVDALRARAAQFDTFARRGLHRFLRFLERLSETGVDPASGIALSPGENAVRVLSIHKSKGLEFPVVCVADLSHRFNLRELSNAIVTDRKWLIGMRSPAGRRGLTLPSLTHEVVAEKRRRAMLAEELRLLYVAMTRARDHLLLSASIANPDQALERWSLWADPPGARLPAFQRLHVQSHLDWVGPAIAGQSTRLDDMAEIARVVSTGSPPPVVVRVFTQVPTAETIAGTPDEPAAAESGPAKGDTRKGVPSEPKPHAWRRQAREALDRVLAPGAPTHPPGLRAKLSVTEIKRLWDYAHEPEDGSPEFPSPSRTAADPYSVPGLEVGPVVPSAAERGTLTHLFLQHLDVRRCGTRETLLRQTEELQHAGVLPGDAAAILDLEALEWFFQTPLGQRLQAGASAIRRELPFTAQLPADVVYRTLADEARRGLAEEFVVVQGVIDCLLVEPEAIRIVDYKTDAVSGPALEARAAAYSHQLQLYARAAAEIFARPVTEAAVVFLHPREIRPVALD